MGKRRKKTKPEIDGIERRMVPNPMITDALYLAELEQKTIQAQPGMIEASVNMATMIGGFARVRNRTEAQTLAVAKFRGLCERSQLGGARAIDYSAVKVDVSGSRENAEIESTDRARREYMGAVQRLGMVRSSMIERMAVYGASVRDLARGAEMGEGGAARDFITREVRDAADTLADHFGYAGSAPDRTKLRQWDDDSEKHFAGEVSTRRAA
jgi:hypothetical protein